MILLTISLYALGFLSGFLLSSYKSSQFAAFQQDYILELLDDTLKLKKELSKNTKRKPVKKAAKKVAKKKPAKKVL